ncbi:putative Metallo-dependent phosphatase [Vibrio nigripulchritudo MADA3029]|uniref:Metallo-dependent phosphatase n=2 Tax=Vibrio nigripulchritudo TaxID=28173 RepID=A0AAV2VX74_9VIBR|nr:UDP-2,3-diacylglucosamine diphosphatase [Vibrio nigripulchritudo]CCN50018.1 putative Metallo-dependent phosphatase [Vibrio nigripulchritudo MADA3020]CCN56144.1 putative Metallo-dependent phosphatase [Vibrio nigripulchritudo MADA3021]CCN59022.1 putative Metallo-dependent phosphatase [Vibrio nigripulchritudo MADA3029]CCN84503.1 putative Metallo-dependent phosphatase [Vibrio nigripulchritudo BLFn1]CCN88691.1 putative Metallo-dependent phosphatase [Vibrio nigripulchritudo SFn27]
MKHKLDVRSMFISDLHLGFKDCKADYLLDLLKNCQADTLYLVGDIIDLQSLRKRMFWPSSHHKVVHRIIKLQQSGTRVIYIPGNHDAAMRRYIKQFFAGVEILPFADFTSLSGKRFLVCHGDQFDSEVCLGKWQATLGDVLYDLLLFINRWSNKFRTMLGMEYFSLSNYIKERIPKASQAITRYQEAGLNYAEKNGYDGIICGHIHYPEVVHRGEMVYVNDGDWIENCTVFVEHHDASMELIYWPKHVASVSKIAAAA